MPHPMIRFSGSRRSGESPKERERETERSARVQRAKSAVGLVDEVVRDTAVTFPQEIKDAETIIMAAEDLTAQTEEDAKNLRDKLRGIHERGAELRAQATAGDECAKVKADNLLAEQAFRQAELEQAEGALVVLQRKPLEARLEALAIPRRLWTDRKADAETQARSLVAEAQHLEAQAVALRQEAREQDPIATHADGNLTMVERAEDAVRAALAED